MQAVGDGEQHGVRIIIAEPASRNMPAIINKRFTMIRKMKAESVIE